MKIPKQWHELLSAEWDKPYIKALKEFLEEEKRRGYTIYPEEEKVFQAFSLPYDKISVVIVGQDPYHGQGQAEGLCFSVQHRIKKPPSLNNIFGEIIEDLKQQEPRGSYVAPESGSLHFWLKQGVFLLNSVLTVRAKEPHSHKNRGWETFTDAVIALLAQRKDPLVFLLWGSAAKAKCASILGKTHHLVLTAPHPSPYSAHTGFFGSRHFSQTNAFLMQHGKQPISWLNDPLSCAK